MRNNEELKRSHANGFGGSDAKMFAKIGHVGIGALSTTEKKRILVALGKMEAADFGGNVYTEAGHLFEEWCEQHGLTAGCEREKYIERNGFEHVTPHGLRHFYATYLISNGVNIKEVARLAGHEDEAMTLKIYTAVTHEGYDKALAVLNAV